MGFFKSLADGLKKTRDSLMGAVQSITGGFSEIDEELYDQLEEALVMADVGTATACDIMEELKKRMRAKSGATPADVQPMLRQVIAQMLSEQPQPQQEGSPLVWLVIGVNGVGKTTTIGKLAAGYTAQGKKVLLAAADTFRAAAIEQLEIWGQRAGAPVIRHSEGSDPAAVVHDAAGAARAQGADVLICDTAGRLHNKKNLMDELSKIRRVIDRELPGCHLEVLLVVDATTGQNALIQARQFKEAAGITALALTKLDGTAKGGVIISICREIGVPVRFVGVGEGVEDLRPFDPEQFAQALLGDGQTDKEEDGHAGDRGDGQ